jgi:hypothetical protein
VTSLDGSIKKLGLLLMCTFCLRAQTPVVLGTAGNFAVLAGSTITNTGPTVVNGNIAVSPGTAITGFGPGIVLGAIHAGDAVAATGKNDLTTAYNDAAGRACPGPPLPGDIGGTVIAPGVYCVASSVGITGTVTLNGNGNPNSVFIFQIGTTLTTAAGNSAVNLIGGAQASNVFWQVGSSATLGTNTIFNGTIMALASVTVTTGAVLNGRALARNGAVSLDSNAITTPSSSPGGGAGGPSVTCSFPSGQVGVAYSSSLVATGGTPPYAYSITAGSLPTGLALNPATGAITGTPSAAGAFGDTSTAVDSVGSASSSSCGITIAAASASSLSLTCGSNSGRVGQPYISSLVAAGGAPPYTYSITAGGLPSGLTLSSSTGAITGSPTAAGAFSDMSRVVDSAGASAASSCAITVATAPAPLSLACSANSGQVGQPYVSSMVAAGGTSPYTYSISAGSLPSGLTLNSSTGAITGTPTAAGTFSETSRVLDSTGASVTSSCGITVVTAPAPLTLTCAANSGQVGQPYVSSMVAAGGTPPYTYSISAGSLPSGLTLNSSTGAITGTPTAAGAFSDMSRVVDSAGVLSASSCGITVATALAPLTLTCATNFGQVGQPYVSSMVAAGGTPPYSYSIITGSLAPGLTLNSSTGAISGTPTAAGTFSYTCRVTDSASTSVSTSSSCGPLIVTSAPPPSVPAPPSLILVMAGLGLTTAYMQRERLLAWFRRS